MTTQSYNYAVYKLRFTLAQQDPDIIGTRYHTVIFVETNANRSGTMYHVTGDITSGMIYQSKLYNDPELSLSFHSKDFLGYTTKSLSAWENLLRGVPPPEKQKAPESNVDPLLSAPNGPSSALYRLFDRPGSLFQHQRVLALRHLLLSTLVTVVLRHTLRKRPTVKGQAALDTTGSGTIIIVSIDVGTTGLDSGSGNPSP
ncbi:uncharacterized protein F4822DRAFT_427876 [Hypoxylon trugodes]|uniref:uncharacterized protein n=1 Tax=Hypoxylon trugodes TaxID=326681 RepID=UPI0021A0202A|nr:uncharacterized protein F4822DRAFT_427876 [Hypoxylon trugodes]KAI1389527.1 hypothetical protein F4822DRAFT_427876 [Hypoxylon trugodes]